jgi:hypothetical protein
MNRLHIRVNQANFVEWIAFIGYFCVLLNAFGFLILSFALSQSSIFMLSLFVLFAVILTGGSFVKKGGLTVRDKFALGHLIQSFILAVIAKMLLKISFMPILMVCLAYVFVLSFALMALYQLIEEKEGRLGRTLLNGLTQCMNN